MGNYYLHKVFIVSLALLLTICIRNSLAFDNEWTYIELGDEPVLESINDIVFDSADSNKIYVGTYWHTNYNIHNGHLYISENSGEDWNSLISEKRIESIAINPQNTDVLYAATYHHGILKSTTGGASWDVMFTGATTDLETFRSIVIDPLNPNIVYTGAVMGKFYKSVNYGFNWQLKNNGLFNDCYFKMNHSIVIDPSNDSTLYIGTYRGVFKSTDQAENWNQLNDTNILAITIDPNNPNTLYCTTEPLADSRGMIKSINAGDSWDNIGPLDIRYFDIVVHPDNSEIILAASCEPGGVMISCDEGITWTSLGLDTIKFRSIAISNNSPRVLYAGTKYLGSYDEGLYARCIPEDNVCGILGDVNRDGAVNSSDALIIMSCDVGMDVSLFCPMSCGDVNDDGFVNSTDALIILSYDVGMYVPFPIGSIGCPSDVNPCAGCSP
ncbi:hypothetical protein HQ585_10670 [candidate division KSB1 bacterium]|nr:hypothetical protein [candidate division KSB1 bacterium]